MAPMVHMHRAMTEPPATIMVLRPKRSVNTTMAMRVETKRTTP